jgi:hypothetical protein
MPPTLRRALPILLALPCLLPPHLTAADPAADPAPTPAPTPAVSTLPAPPTPAATTAAIGELLTRLKRTTHATGNPALAPLGGELGTKTQALARAVEGNPLALREVENVLRSILDQPVGKALGTLQELIHLKFTTAELNFVRDVRDAGCAYLTRKHLDRVEGGESDVTALIATFRQGRTRDVLPAARTVASNPRLTTEQKAFADALVAAFTPAPPPPPEAVDAPASAPAAPPAK